MCVVQGDCALLPIEHSTTEELAAYMWFRILQARTTTTPLAPALSKWADGLVCLCVLLSISWCFRVGVWPQSFGAERLLCRGITSLEIIVAEAPQQEATFRRPIALGVSDRWRKHLQSFASKPAPCLARSAPSTPTAKQSSSSSSSS